MNHVIDFMETMVSPQSRNKRDRDMLTPDKDESNKDIGEKSPTHKKIKGCEIDKEKLVEDIKAISEIINKVESMEAKTLISCYMPAIRCAPEIIMKNMKETCKDWTYRREALISAISSITNEYSEGEDGDEIKNKSIEELIEILIGEIQNRMTRYCRECEQQYRIELSESPEVKCTICKVGKHECENSIKVKENIGLYWFCNDCEKVFEEQYLHKIDRTALFIGFEKRVKDLNTEKEDTTTKENNDKTKNTPKLNQSEGQKDQAKQKQKDEELKQQEAPPENPDTEQKNKQNEEKVCRYWKNKNCRYGERCRDGHPNKCQNILEYGECENKRCEKIHPEVCYLIYQGHCNRKNCKYVHPKNTFRTKTRANDTGSRSSWNPYNTYDAYNNWGYASGYYDHDQYYNHHFPGNWPTPYETIGWNWNRPRNRGGPIHPFRTKY